MELFNNFKDLFLSVWDRGILGIDIFEILIGLGIFLIFLIFRGLISKLIIKKLEVISKRTTNQLDDTFVKSMVGCGQIFDFCECAPFDVTSFFGPSGGNRTPSTRIWWSRGRNFNFC